MSVTPAKASHESLGESRVRDRSKFVEWSLGYSATEEKLERNLFIENIRLVDYLFLGEKSLLLYGGTLKPKPLAKRVYANVRLGDLKSTIMCMVD